MFLKPYMYKVYQLNPCLERQYENWNNGLIQRYNR